MAEEINIRTELINYLDARPFAPNVIVMASGDRFEVSGNHAAAVGQNVVTVHPPDGRSHSVLRLNQITSLTVMNPV